MRMPHKTEMTKVQHSVDFILNFILFGLVSLCLGDHLLIGRHHGLGHFPLGLLLDGRDGHQRAHKAHLPDGAEFLLGEVVNAVLLWSAFISPCMR